MREFVNAANLLTTGNLAAGVVAVLLAAQGRLGAAAVAVAIAALLDTVDGIVARRFALSGRFGSHLDSLADLSAFGVAPALLLHEGSLSELPVIGTVACVGFVVGGAWRLARFPLVEDRHQFIGLPIPPSGLAAAGIALTLPTGIALALTLALAWLMVSAIRFPTLASVMRMGSAMRARQAPATGSTGKRRQRRVPRLGDGRAVAARARARARRKRPLGHHEAGPEREAEGFVRE